MKVLLTGATGFFGGHLTRHLEAAGHEVLPVSRTPGLGCDWSEESLRRGVAETDAVVNLAGENLFARRWNAGQKERLRASRIEGTRRLAALLAERERGVLINASAVGYYGPRDATPVDEGGAAGDDFLARLCADWEAAAAAPESVRVAIVRIGVILGADDGALKRMLLPFRLGLGGPVGSGQQPFPWIHVDDLARLFLFLLERDDLLGVFNGTAPGGVSAAELARALGKALHRPALFPVPGFVLKVALGEVSSVLLTGQNVTPKRALDSGFEFRFPEVDAALGDLLAK